MALEIERKFLVQGTPWQDFDNTGIIVKQGYLSTEAHCVVRVRLCTPLQKNEQHSAFITIKSRVTDVSSHEYEYAIPFHEAEFILNTLIENSPVEKIRHRIPHGEAMWEVDEFLGVNQGLAIAEIELKSEEESFALPPWLGEEVTHNMRYKNVELAKKPFNTW